MIFFVFLVPRWGGYVVFKMRAQVKSGVLDEGLEIKKDMDKEKYDMARLIALYMAGELTPRERERLMRWVGNSEQNQAFFERVCKEKGLGGRYARWQGIDSKAGFVRFARRVRGRRIGWSGWIGYAAAAVVAFGVAAWLLWGKGMAEEPVVPVAERILPGERRATLLLSSGEELFLDGKQDSLTREEGGALMTTSENGVVYERRTGGQNEREGETLFNTLRTSKGGEYTVELSDGTVVYLNAVSELRYPVEFGDDERVVCFSGEGYFDVAKDAKRPFRVVVGGMSVVVRGTEFNVNTFKEAGVQTVLVEGAVGVRVNGKEEVRLKPSQLAEYNAESGLVSVREVDAREYVAWKDGFFVFDDESLEEIMGTLSRWYDVEVFYVNEGAKELHFTGHLKRYDDIDVILRAIESAVDVTFSVNGRMVSVVR